MNVATSQQITAVHASNTLAMSEHHLRTWDGTTLFYRAWQRGYSQKKALILFHGGHEHSGRFQDLVDRLALQNFSVFAWDARGHGRSPGKRGYARHFHDFVRDADSFLRHISTTHGIAFEDMVLLGHSVGSVVISTWLQDYARGVRGALLGSPAFHVKLYAPLALTALKVCQRFRPGAFVNSYVKPGFLTHDEEEAEARRQDPLISPRIAVRVLTSLFDTGNRVIKNAASITTPILIFSAGSDWVVKRSAHEQFFRRLGSTRKALQLYPGFFHEVFHEKDRQLVIDQVRGFIEAIFDESAATQRTSALPIGYTATQPMSIPFHRKLGYRIMRLALKTVGRLSTGIHRGWQVGFDAGRSLDYVYENTPSGISSLGRAIDRIYLNSIGWRRIRERQAHLQKLLLTAIERIQRKRRAVHILDVASGPGRAVLDTLAQLNDPEISAVCRDFAEGELICGQRAANARRIKTIEFERRDAFDPTSYADLQPSPDIVIVSGLYELFSDNAIVLRSLRAIQHAMRDDGTLIYTNQPYHPQLELIAGMLDDRNKRPWVMRPRSQAEMNRLLIRAGFELQDMLLDVDGIFVVGVATKRTTT